MIGPKCFPFVVRTLNQIRSPNVVRPLFGQKTKNMKIPPSSSIVELPTASGVGLATNALPMWRIFALTSIAVFLVSLDGTVMFAAFPAIRAAFPDVSPSELSWILNAYTIVFAGLLVPSGRLADLLGRKRLFLLGLIVFTLASVACGIAPNPRWLTLTPVLQQAWAPQRESEYWLLWPPDRQHVPKLRVFVDHLVAVFEARCPEVV